MADEWFNVMEIEKQTGIADSTLRRYIRNHGHNLQIKKRGKSYLISGESIPVIKKIRELYDKGKQLEDIEEALRRLSVPVTITMTEDKQEVTVNVAEALQDMQKSMAELNQKYDELLNAYKEQQEYFDRKLEVRDQNLIEVLEEDIKSRRQSASSVEVEEKKSFWQRLLGK
ncbi:MerR family transcriptional regulator [Peribacillus butanolivorans]|uniref:MerR family transcriptional regulator n=1 Tax=Peribacillus butanolivorans TaxID=421767 RepID=UPI002E211B65|nr:MerR family transcriptional regulator [Peribacillus butanolivorans]MED3690735.1 MerR family transcriptional regulator [Peribacillus butanolivorans]